jgi:branched-chain amino acid transport system permease protein
VKRSIIAIGLAALATVPLWVGNTYYINIASQILLYAVFALGLNVLVGYAGLVSLGHAGLFGIAAYAGALLINSGNGHFIAVLGALAVTLFAAAVFAILSLRGTGLGFVMITVALGQIVWGIAYRWISITNGDNGISVAARPMPFGVSLASAQAFYYLTLSIFVLVVAAVFVFVRSPLGAALTGTRDQPRRMDALGYHVWMIRFWACMFSGLLTGVAGILFVYYNQFISPQTLALTSSAEVLLMVISGGASTLLGPIVGAGLVVVVKNIVSAYIERWNFMLGAIFVAIVILMPEGLVPGTARLWRTGSRALRGRNNAVVTGTSMGPKS